MFRGRGRSGYPVGGYGSGGFSGGGGYMGTGTHTSSSDPQSLDCRVFVGGLNTVDCDKSEIEMIFSQYGPISAVSLHKGFGFVQYNEPTCARLACGEHGRFYNGMKWDVNLAAERQGQKRSATQMSSRGRGVGGGRGGGFSRGGRGSSGGYSSGFSSSYNLGFAAPSPAKRARGFSSSRGRGSTRGSYTQPAIDEKPGDEETKDDSSQDLMVCGWCKELYRSLDDFTNHRKKACVIKFTCKCKFLSQVGDLAKDVLLQCAMCGEEFTTAWDLCYHAQNTHGLVIYNDGTTQEGTELDQQPQITESGDATNFMDTGNTLNGE